MGIGNSLGGADRMAFSMGRNPFLDAWWRILLVLLIGLLLAWLILSGPPSCRQTSEPAASLPALGARLTGTTVSGLSSGAYMAGQFQLAQADIVAGAAIVAGGPFACAESAFAGIFPEPGVQFLSASRAINGCMLDTLSIYGVPDPEALAERARELSNEGRIGAIADIVTDRVYVFSGTRDQVVRPRIVGTAVEFYKRLGIPEAQIEAVMNMPAGHAMITLDHGAACDATTAPFIVDCDYDQVGAIFSHLYVPVVEPSGPAAGRFLEFDQQEFTTDLANHGLKGTAILYIPPNCEDGGCRLHVAFHGCEQNRNDVGMAFVSETGYGRWADANRIVVLFPEVADTALNPKGCWDWWGYTGRDYLTRDAPQIKAVRRMLDRLASTAEAS
jgi:poly(3-hydroxybutyrate) depolymerase